MKKCSTCKQVKNESEFYKHKRSKDGLNWSCKQCANSSNTKTRHKNPKQYLGYRETNRQQVREEIAKWKSERGCVICGEKDFVCLDLHHLDPTVKDLNPSQATTSLKRFLVEAKKCVVMCANHHRKLHAGNLVI